MMIDYDHFKLVTITLVGGEIYSFTSSSYMMESTEEYWIFTRKNPKNPYSVSFNKLHVMSIEEWSQEDRALDEMTRLDQEMGLQ